MQATKICTKCGQQLPLEMFVLDKNKCDGHASLCRPCNRARLKEWSGDNREHLLEYQRRWYNKNIEARRAKSRRWQSRIKARNLLVAPELPATKMCPRCKQERLGSQFYKSKVTKDGLMCYCKFCLSDEQKTRRLSNPEWREKQDKERWSKLTEQQKSEMTARSIAWHKAHLPERNKRRIVLHKIRLKTDSGYYWQCRIRSAIRLALKGHSKSSPTEVLLGCSFTELRRHIELLWQPGMSWENYGMYGWHIDHKLPVDSFDLSKPEDQRACFHHTNLQPLWASENLRKSNKLT